MKNCAKIIYAISVTLIAILLATFAFHSPIDEDILRGDTSFEIVRDYELAAYKNEDAPIGITQEYKWILQDIPEYNGCITFYIVHQAVDVYVGDELIYSLKVADHTSISKTTGYEWAKVYVDEEDNGKEIRVRVHPIYETSLANILKIYSGDFNAIRTNVMLADMPVMSLAVLAIIIGIAFIVFFIVNLKNEELDRSIFMLGIFSIVAGMWKICDMTVAPLIFDNSLLLSTIAISAITMMIFPFMSFIQNQLHKANSISWTIAGSLCTLCACAVLLLQLCGVADLRETLTASHIMIVMVIVYVMINVVREANRTQFSSKLKLTIGCCLLCILGVVVDMAVYYYSGNSGSMIYCLLSFLIYAILMGLMSARETKRLIDRGHQADHYHDLALHDTLTGLYNRAFYYEFLKEHNVYRENCFIIMMDVNDLKLCNDTMGHDWGDELLINSAKLIKEAFPIGECLRMGGDEFCVLLPESSEAECKLCLNTFDELLEKFNETNPNAFPVSIAYGYANYVKKIDLDFSDTLRRADRMMYQMKMDMKTYEN
ncbi:MAG: diguanylate cyclase [Roseburia sp.]|nr:diguanylate cyclase [Roseburia sp.]